MKKAYNILFLFVALIFASCADEPDKYEVTGGTPTISYIRPVDKASADSLLTGAFMDNEICIVGENLRSIVDMKFNDQKAQLIPSLITDNTLIVTVPGTIPGEVFNKIFMTNNKGVVTEYDFKVLVPGPKILTMENEWAPAGDAQSIYGSYFINDPNVPLTLKIGGQAVKIDKFTDSQIQFTVPDGLTANSEIEITTVYGSKKAPFRYKDSRGMITNFDNPDGFGDNSGTKGIVPQGWNLAVTYSAEGGIDGYYAQVGDGTLKMPADGGWTEGFKISWWCGNWNGDPMSITEGAGAPLRNIFPAGYFAEPEKLALKFEMCIPASNKWEAGVLQVLFMNNKVAANDSWQNNTYIQPETGLCRGLYAPWNGSGSFDTNGKWITVTMPIENFTYNMDGTAGSTPITPESFDSFTIWPVSGGLEGNACTPIIRYDNIRIVPIK
ncbi:MAG: glycan-binding surface protein [Bacteroidaceae bacterium]|nr:glycan-binding surface protein [Bacteroidaceae bacterium]